MTEAARARLLGAAVVVLAVACAALFAGPELLARSRFRAWRAAELRGDCDYAQRRALVGRGVRLLRDAALHDPERTVRESAMFVLTRIVLDAPGAAEALRAVAWGTDAAEREGMLAELQMAVYSDRPMEPHAIEALVQIACTPDADVRGAASRTIVEILSAERLSVIPRLGEVARGGRAGAREVLEALRSSDSSDVRSLVEKELATLPRKPGE